MTTIELKLSLIQRLTMINDENLLNKIMELIESASEEKVLFFSHELKSALEHAREKVKAGKMLKDEDLEHAMAKWVSENKIGFSHMTDIFEFYNTRDGNVPYSAKLFHDFRKTMHLVISNPWSGLKTEDDHIRYVIVENYALFYQLSVKRIDVLVVWDCKQESGKLEIKIKRSKST